MLQYACELEALKTSLKLRVILDQEAILVLYQDGQVSPSKTGVLIWVCLWKKVNMTLLAVQ